MTQALTCSETVKQRLCVTSEIETRLPCSTVSCNSVVDHRSQRPVLSLHYLVMLTGVMSNHIGHQDASHRSGSSKDIAYMGQLEWTLMIYSILSNAVLQRKEGGATLASTGSHEIYVECRQSEIRRMELCNWVSGHRRHQGKPGVGQVCVRH